MNSENTARDPDLARLFDAVGAALLDRTAPGTGVGELSRRIFAALSIPAPVDATATPARLPACDHLDAALEGAGEGPGAAVAEAFGRLAPRLAWRHKLGDFDEAFLTGHANTYFAGPGGLEPRQDVVIGASLLAPDVRYPDHDHPPEEVYFVLTPGEWRQNDDPWHEPGPGGTVHNVPNIRHAMRSGPAPLLAVWCLWLGS